jgi:predicted ATPase
MSELRAATRLARLAPGRDDATARVRAVYDTFTEGFDTPDLIEARAVLDGS